VIAVPACQPRCCLPTGQDEWLKGRPCRPALLLLLTNRPPARVLLLSLQAIMRQPALLLHDGTINPSTYDKESIAQWLAEHRCVWGGGGGGGFVCVWGKWGVGGPRAPPPPPPPPPPGGVSQEEVGTVASERRWGLWPQSAGHALACTTAGSAGHCIAASLSIILGGDAQWRVGHGWGLWQQSTGHAVTCTMAACAAMHCRHCFSFCHAGRSKQACAAAVDGRTYTETQEPSLAGMCVVTKLKMSLNFVSSSVAPRTHKHSLSM
jgi:hypothetical protein